MRRIDIFSSATDQEVNDFHKLIGQNIKYFRKKAKMSQLELALLIGQKSATFFANAENNRKGTHFNIEHLFKISKALEIDIDELCKLHDN
jgi:transcriptional regulator with XRE-family HTH domain